MRKEKEDKIINKLNEFIIKYYKNQLLKGLIYFVSILLVFFLVFSSLEYYSQFNWTENPEDPYVWYDDKGLWYAQQIGTGIRVYF